MCASLTVEGWGMTVCHDTLSARGRHLLESCLIAYGGALCGLWAACAILREAGYQVTLAGSLALVTVGDQANRVLRFHLQRPGRDVVPADLVFYPSGDPEVKGGAAWFLDVPRVAIIEAFTKAAGRWAKLPSVERGRSLLGCVPRVSVDVLSWAFG